MDKKDVVAIAEAVKGKVMTQVDKTQVMAEKELSKIKKHLESTYKTAESFAKKNPEKAATIAAGIGAALGAAGALLMKSAVTKKGKKK
ncbi:MAG: hypothetical protein COZ86_02680 [Candidatus Moranbacteria bacterium CG_4_8_14_3_um_filter_41_13]|nr:MAG: hypothetical protein AUK58_00615 [Candidatus Moranbacteria bacterium CG2_30_41_165]PIP25744.1 MAG: hypothetical protein COX32_01715 [Candidatus Moranbacteria bacterium CG23_combo_of_CG06-09_8_20_14_all_41_28]PIW94126.1 MAG: hypothetical protein COZ86_02680 [Candidatus Moranbacteria bacterium CG_4_8_14_3_um_filter_41_13]